MAEDRECWRAGDLVIDVGRQRVERDGMEIELAPLSFRFLLELVRAAPNVLTLDRLMDRVWPGLVVSPDTVSQRVKLLREALGDSAREPRYVAGMRGRGYTLAVAAQRVAAPETLLAAPPPAPAAERELTVATRSDAQPVVAADAPAALRPGRAPWAVALMLFAAIGVIGAVAYFQLKPTPPGGPVRLAILPFASGSPDDAYVASGLTDEVIESLSRASTLRVILGAPQNSTRDGVAPREVGRQLNATHLLKGSVQRGAGGLRISTQLVRADDASVLWAGNYDRQADALTPFSDELAAATMRALGLQFAPAARKNIPGEAHRLYLMGDYLTQRKSREGLAEALRLYDQALTLAPDYAAAWEGKARVYQFLAREHWIPLEEGYARARELANEAISADASYGLAHARVGALDLVQGDFAGAARHIQRGLELDPNHQLTLGNAAVLLRSLGRLEAAARLGSAADELNPLNPAAMLSGALLDLARGRASDAERRLRAALALDARHPGAGFYLAVALLQRGDVPGARAALDQESLPAYRLRGRVMLEHLQGRDAEADAALGELQREFDAGTESAYGMATAFSLRGRPDEAFQWLDRAAGPLPDYDFKDLAVDPLLAALHPDARWNQLLARLHRTPAELAAIPFRIDGVVSAR